jgi:hypothetical protein
MNISRALILLLPGLLLTAGCSPQFQPSVEKVYAPRQFTGSELRDGGVAVGCCILAHGVELYPTPDLPDIGSGFDHFAQSYLWSLLLDGVWAQRLPETPVLPFSVFEDRVPPADLTRALNQFAELRTPEPAVIQALAAARPGPRYLLLARVDGDELGYDSTNQMGNYPPEGGLGRISDLGREDRQPARPLNPEVYRVVTVTMEMLDLEKARSVWEGKVQREDRQRVEPNIPADDARFRVEKQGEDQVVFARDEALPDSPAFAELLRRCLEALVGQLVTDRPPIDNEDVY